MDLLIDNFNINLKKLQHVTNVFCNYSKKGEISIHLQCGAGFENALFELLPKYVHDTMEVTKSDQHVFLKAKK